MDRGRVRPFVRGGEPLLRTRGMVGSPSVYGKTPTRQLNCTPHCCLCTWPHRKANQLIRRCHPYARKPAPQAVLSRMQLTLHATHRTPHGASRLGLAMFAWLVGESRACSGPSIGGMRGSTVIRLRPCMIRSTSPPHTHTNIIRTQSKNSAVKPNLHSVHVWLNHTVRDIG